MTTLTRLQEQFLACLHDDDAPLPAGWGAAHAAGMAVYRNAYRARLIDVVGESYPRTARLVGADAFEQAAAHHLIVHPPSTWTIDRAGDGFAESCDELFAHDPDVGELAWLEWAMQCAFTAADDPPLTLADFAAATAGFGAAQWEALTFSPIAGTALRQVTHDLARLWISLSGEERDCAVERLEQPQWALVWRESGEAVFALLPDADGMALDMMLRGATFGAVCAGLADRLPLDAIPAAAGEMLSHWLRLGLIRSVDCA